MVVDVVVRDDGRPCDIGVFEDVRHLRMVSSFLQVEAVGLLSCDAFHNACSEPCTAIVGLSVHVDIDGLAVEGACQIELSSPVNPQGMLDDLWSCLLERSKRLAAELQLSLEVRMLVHEVQQIVVDDGEFPPDGGTHIAVVVHVAMQDIGDVNLLLSSISSIYKRSIYRFTYTALSKFVKGEENKAITSFKLNENEGFGMLKEKSNSYVYLLLKALIDFEILKKTKDGKGYEIFELGQEMVDDAQIAAIEGYMRPEK